MSSGGERRPERDEAVERWCRVEEPRIAEVKEMAAAIERWGAAFVAYLLLPDVDLLAGHLERDFIDAYAGWYPDRSSVVRIQLEFLGWTDALAGFRTAHGLPENAIAFDEERVWAHCQVAYDFVERLGGVHAFLR